MGYTQKLGLLAQSVFQDSSLNVGIGAAPSGTYKFEVTGTAKVSSNLGIGATLNAWISTAKALQLNDTASLFGPTSEAILANNLFVDATDNNKYITTNFASQYRQVNGQHLFYSAASGTANGTISFGSPKLTIASNGTASFLSFLNVNGASAANPLTVKVDTNLQLRVDTYLSTTNVASINGDASAYADMRIDSTKLLLNQQAGGKVGVGSQANPSKLFSVEKSVAGDALCFVYNTANTSTDTLQQWRLGSNCNNTSATYLSAGIFGVADKIYFYGNGNIVNANNSYGLLSDIKLKENIVDATPKLEDILKVRIVNYNLKTDPDVKQLGVIAQELEQIFPGLIDEHLDKDEEGNLLGTTTKMVKMSIFVPMLIKAMQEQQAQIEELKALIADK